MKWMKPIIHKGLSKRFYALEEQKRQMHMSVLQSLLNEIKPILNQIFLENTAFISGDISDDAMLVETILNRLQQATTGEVLNVMYYPAFRQEIIRAVANNHKNNNDMKINILDTLVS